jgi:hypothetical protein
MGVMGQLTIKADDGDVQIERYEVTDSTAGAAATFQSTGLTFFVCRKPGHIVDNALGTISTATYIKYFVNGKDTGVTQLGAAILPSINNRMPATFPIAGGASVQIRSY